MILTKDNLLRFIREKKYVTPTIIAENFETSTMIASAALSELSKDKHIGITELKLGASPYYYDLKQKECLVELGKKHFSKYDLDIFLKLEKEQILNDISLTIQERLAVTRIKDFAVPLELKFQDKELKFWVWYLRDLKETREQILEVLKSHYTLKESPKEESQKVHESTHNHDHKERREEPKNTKIIQEKTELPSVQKKKIMPTTIEQNEEFETQYEEPKNNEDNKVETFIEEYLAKHYLKIENKIKQEKGILYNAILKINSLNIRFDCFFFYKKPNEGEIFKFYNSSQKPKIVFMINAPKKLYSLSEVLENFFVVNI